MIKNLSLLLRRFFSETDLTLFFMSIATTLCGLVAIYSATRSYGTDRYFYIQIVAILLGVIGMIVISRLDYERICELYKFVFAFNILLLIIVLIFGSGVNDSNNKNWIRLGPISIQLAEIVKIGFVLTFAKHIDMLKEHISSIKNFLILMVHAGIIIGLVLIQGDMGNALVFVFAAMCMMFAAGLSYWYFIGGFGAVLISFPFIWTYILKPYQQGRILAGFSPELDPTGYGYQALQSKIAIGAGKVFGKGFLNGLQTQNGFLPAKHTDFIFGVIGEEFGLIGCSIIIILLCSIIIRCLFISQHAKNDLGSLICIGMAAIIAFQMIENIGMCLGLLPVIGITLPFISYGGSSVFGMLCSVGLIMSVYSRRKPLNFGAI
jgi:rod shape determining protein RodA